MAEVGESKQRLEKQSKGWGKLEKRERKMKGNHKRTKKKKLRRKGLKVWTLVDEALFQAGRYKWRTCGGVSGVITSAGVLKNWAPELREGSDTCFWACSPVNQCSRLLLLFLRSSPPGTDGGLEVKMKITRAWWRWETCWTYFSSDKKRLGKLRVVDFWRAWGVIRSLSRGMSLLISSRRDFCYFSAVPFKIVLQERLDCWFWTVSGLKHLTEVKTEEKLNASCFLGSIHGS